MNTNNPQTELQTALDELGLSRNAYIHSIMTLSYQELHNECLRQYDMSGEMLDKYRNASSKLAETRDIVHKKDNEIMTLRHDLDNAERAIDAIVSCIGIMKNLFEVSKDYTHAMKRTIVTAINDTFNAKLGNLETVLYRRDVRNGKTGYKNDIGDIPF